MPGVLLNFLQCPGQPPPLPPAAENDQAPNAKSVKGEKLVSSKKLVTKCLGDPGLTLNLERVSNTRQGLFPHSGLDFLDSTMTF